MDDDDSDEFFKFSWKIKLTNKISTNERLNRNFESREKVVESKEKVVQRKKTVRERLAEIQKNAKESQSPVSNRTAEKSQKRVSKNNEARGTVTVLTNKTSVNEKLNKNVESKKDVNEMVIKRTKTIHERLAEIQRSAEKSNSPVSKGTAEKIVSKNNEVQGKIVVLNNKTSVNEKLNKNVESKIDAKEKVVKSKKTVRERLIEILDSAQMSNSVLNGTAEKSQKSVLKNNETEGKAVVSKSNNFGNELPAPTKTSVCRKLFNEIDSPSKATASVKSPMKVNYHLEKNSGKETSLKTSSPLQNKFRKAVVPNEFLEESNKTGFKKIEPLNDRDEFDVSYWKISLSRKSFLTKVPVDNKEEKVTEQVFHEAEDQKPSENENIEVLRDSKAEERPKKQYRKKTQGSKQKDRVETESNALNSSNRKKLIENVKVGSETRNDNKPLSNSRNVSMPFEVLDLHLPVNFEPKENRIGDGLTSFSSTASSSIRRSLRINKEENVEGKYFPKKSKYIKKKKNNLKEVDSELLTKSSEQSKNSKKKKVSESSKEKENNVERIGVNTGKSPARNGKSNQSRAELERKQAKETKKQSPQKIEAQFSNKEENVTAEKRRVRKRVSTVTTAELEQEAAVPGKKTKNSSPHKAEAQFIDKDEENVNAKKHPRRKCKSAAKLEQKPTVPTPSKKTEKSSSHKAKDQFSDKEEAVDVSLDLDIPSKRLKTEEPANEEIIVYDSNSRGDMALNCVQHQAFYKFDVAKNETAAVAKILRHERFATGIMKLSPKEEKGYRFTLGDTLAFWISRGTLEVTIHETKVKLFENDSFYVPAENGYNIVNLSDYEAIIIFFQLKSDTA